MMSCLLFGMSDMQGGRNHLQSGFAAHMRGVVSRHRSTAQRGADPDPLRDVQAYLAVKFRDKGLLDITAPGGVDTTWAQVSRAVEGAGRGFAVRIIGLFSVLPVVVFVLNR
jgi:nuclear pore complex protein Nup93